jgi:hypothetical protein
LKVLSSVNLESLPNYDGPNWLDRALTNKERVAVAVTGFGAELDKALEGRRRWLLDNRLAELKPSGEWVPKPGMRKALQAREQARIVHVLTQQLNANYIPHEPGSRVSGVYERSIATPTGRLALIRREDTYTLAPWKALLEPMRGQAVTAVIGHNRVVWSLDRGRGLPGRG